MEIFQAPHRNSLDVSPALKILRFILRKGTNDVVCRNVFDIVSMISAYNTHNLPKNKQKTTILSVKTKTYFSNSRHNEIHFFL